MATLAVSYAAVPVQKQELTVAATSATPQIVIPPSRTEQTLIMFDPDSSQPAYIHWMVVIPASGVVAEGNTIFNYTPPAPSPGTGIDIPGRGKGHRYYFALFNGSIPDDKIPQTRGKFPIKAFQEQLGLQWTAWNGFWVIT